MTIPCVLDLAAGLTQVLADNEHSYLYGNGRIAQYGETGNEYFLGDALGSVRQLAGEYGEITLTRNYRPYGEILSSAGYGESVFAFTGEAYDTSTNLIYLRARFYAPSQGRFTSRDVWEGDYYQPLSYNIWLYTFADPTNQVDPSGMYPQIDGYNEKVSPAGITWTLVADPLRSGAGGIPYGVNQAQFKINPNSCGPVSAAAIIRSKAPSATAQVVYEKAKEMTAQVPGFDSPNNLGPGELEKLISQFVLDKYDTQWYAEWGYIDDWITGKPYHWKEPEGAQQVANQLTQWLSASYLIVTGVMANRSSGKILPSYGGTTGHWVVITGISANWEQGEKWDSALNWVRVYNPFDNETEYYPWRDFRDSWSKDGNMLVLVKPTNIPYEHRSCK